MDSLNFEKCRLLLPCVFALMGVIFHFLSCQPGPTIEKTSATDSREGLIEVAPGSFSIIFLETSEPYVSEVDTKVVPERTVLERSEPPQRDRIADASGTAGSLLAPSQNAAPTQTSPESVAKSVYTVFWKEFIGDMNLSEEPAVRAIITEWHQFNLELIFVQQEGNFTIFELTQSIRPVEDLKTHLAPYVSTSQLIDIVVNFQAFTDYIAGQNGSLGLSFPSLPV